MKLKSFIIKSICIFACAAVTTACATLYAKPNVDAIIIIDRGVTDLKSNITEMNLKGYVGTNLKNNIKYWQKTAYRNNTNIIEQILRANQDAGTSFGSVLGTDFFGVDSYYDIDIVDHNGSNAIGFTLKRMPASFGDRDIAFSRDQTAVTDWTGAYELWFEVDASEAPEGISFRLTIEENSVGRETWSLIPGKSVYTISNSSRTPVVVEDGGYVPLPAGFRGIVALPLNEQIFSRYFNDNGNGRFDLSFVAQMITSIKGKSSQIDKTIYVDNFAIVGNVDGVTPPYTATDASFTYKTVWDMQALSPRDGYTASSLPWYGEFVGKLLTGMAYCYKVEPDEELLSAAEEIIDELEKAQGADGYLGVFKGGARFSINASNWDLWNHYHCVVGLIEWYKLTKNEKALSIAIKALDLIYETFKDKTYLVAGGFETNRGIAHGYAVAYQVTGDEKYLAEAERIITQDCQDSNGWYKSALFGRHFYTSSSARWEVLHMIMTLGILYQETGKREYYDVMSEIWEDILLTDVHNDGGFTTNEGAIGDPYADGVIETCCTVAWMAFTNEYYKYNKTSVVADELERSYYNAMLGSLLDDDKYCSYNTPMNGIQGSAGGYDGRRVTSQQDISFQFNNGSPDFNCCQANLARGLGQIVEWACVSDENALYLNYYGTSTIRTSVDGLPVTIKQTTGYPVDGKVKIEISGLERDAEFTLFLRIPSWAKGSRISLDGVSSTAECGRYYELKKSWRNGDAITLDLAMNFHFWKGKNSSSDTLTSVYYGPILLALDGNYSSSIGHAFSVKDFENATVNSGAANGCMAFVDVPLFGGDTVRLVDFASAGKYNGNAQPSTYVSWLKVTDSSVVSDDAHKRWTGSDKNYVLSSEDLSLPRRGYYAGEFVEIAASDDITSITANGTTLVPENGKYRFAMPDKDVILDVVYKETPDASASYSSESHKPSNGGSGCSGIGAGAATAACVVTAGAAFIAKKRRRRQ